MLRSLGVATLVLLAACNQDRRHCEHARGVMVEQWKQTSEQAIAGADPASQDELRARADAETQKADARFMDKCIALQEPAKGCIARIDELLAIQKTLQAERDACPPGEDGFPDQACTDAAKAKAEKAVGRCASALDDFTQTLFAP